MHLFLTSSPCDDDGARGMDIPFVFREDNGFAARLRACVAAGSRGVMLAAYPDAWARNDAMAADFASAFAAMGRPLREMQMLDSRLGAEGIRAAVRSSGVIILSGGHVPTQNRWFAEIGLAAMLRDYPGTVVGISAGSMNCCGEVYAQPEEAGEAVDPAYRRFLPGLGLTEVMILPHLQLVRESLVDGLRLFEDITIPDSAGRVFYAIPDGSYVLQEDVAQKEKTALLCGESWRIADGEMTRWTVDGETREIAD